MEGACVCSVLVLRRDGVALLGVCGGFFECVCGGALECDGAVGDGADGDGPEEAFVGGLVEEGGDEGGEVEPVFEECWGDASGEPDAGACEVLEGGVARLRAVDGEEDFDGFLAERRGVLDGCFGDDLAVVDGGVHGFGEPRFLGESVGVSEEFEDVDEARARGDAFVGDPAEAIAEVSVEVDLEVVAWCEVGVSAFGGEGCVFGAIPVDGGDAEACAGGDDGGVALVSGFALVDDGVVVRGEGCDAVGGGFEVVEEGDVLCVEEGPELGGVDDPWEVCGGAAVTLDGSCDAEAGGGGRVLGCFEELFDEGGESRRAA